MQKQVTMPTMISLFQTASGSWHWPSILMAIGWLVTGLLMFATLYANRNDRVKSAHQVDEITTQLTATQEKLAPWKLSDVQEETFMAYLKDAPKGRVAIEYIRSDEKRSRDFAIKIKDMLAASGYDVWGYMAGFEQADSPPLIGVQILIKDKQSDVVGGFIQRAFKGIGIEAEGAHRANNNYEDDRVVIWIGIKP
jgi:hypothetical protein